MKFLKYAFNKDLFATFSVIFFAYMILFLLYLNYKFAKNKTSLSIEDPLLSRAVSFIVFIKNKQLHKESLLLLEGREEEEPFHHGLIDRAEENAKLYKEHEANGLRAKLAESILLEYMDERALSNYSFGSVFEREGLATEELLFKR